MLNGPQVYYTDATAHSLRHAWWIGSAGSSRPWTARARRSPGHTGSQVGASVSVTDY